MLSLEDFVFDGLFCDLDGVERGSFSEVISDCPQDDCLRVVGIDVHTADEDGVFGCALYGCYITCVLLFIEEGDAVCFFERVLAGLEVYRIFACSEECDGVSDEDGHAHAESGEVNVFVEDFFCL